MCDRTRTHTSILAVLLAILTGTVTLIIGRWPSIRVDLALTRLEQGWANPADEIVKMDELASRMTPEQGHRFLNVVGESYGRCSAQERLNVRRAAARLAARGIDQINVCEVDHLVTPEASAIFYRSCLIARRFDLPLTRGQAYLQDAFGGCYHDGIFDFEWGEADRFFGSSHLKYDGLRSQLLVGMHVPNGRVVLRGESGSLVGLELTGDQQNPAIVSVHAGDSLTVDFCSDHIVVALIEIKGVAPDLLIIAWSIVDAQDVR